MKIFSAAVVGLGQIGQGYDYEQSGKEYVKTHATGITFHPGFQMVGGVDPDREQRKRFEIKFNCPSFKTPIELFDHVSPEIIAVAVPTMLHKGVFDTVLKFEPRAVVCEKPISENLETAREMVAAAEQKRCSMLVNYGRRFDPSVTELKEQIEKNDFGRIYKGVVWYSKGLRNNGSHFIDLLRFLLGGVSGIRIFEAGRCFNGDDPEPDFAIRFGDAVITFLAAKEECFTHCEMELIGTGGSIKYLQAGGVVEAKKAVPHPQYPGYRSLEEKGKIKSGCLKQVMFHCYSQLYDHLAYGNMLNSEGTEALKTIEAVDAVIRGRETLPRGCFPENIKNETGDSHE